MTLDKMIEALTPVYEDLGTDTVSVDVMCWSLPHVSKEQREAIIIALRAGQIMRDTGHLPGVSFIMAARAWDAVMGTTTRDDPNVYKTPEGERIANKWREME